MLHFITKFCIGLFCYFLCLFCLRLIFFLISGRLCFCCGFPCHLCCHDQLSDAGHIILRMEDLQCKFAAMCVQCICQFFKRWNLAVIIKHWRRRCCADWRHIANNNIGSPALGKTLIKSKAARPYRAVALLIPRCQRRKHDPVF